MNEEFNWLEYSENMERAAAEAEESAGRHGLRRFLPRRPKLPGLPRFTRPRLPGLLGLPRLPRLPRLRRRAQATASAQALASELLGGQSNRPVEELDDRLRALRERSGSGAAPAAAPNQRLFDVDEVLVSSAFQQKPGGVISAAALSKAQQQQVEMLKDIVGGTLQTPADADRRLPRPTRLFSLSALPRLLGSTLLVLTASLPFVSSDFAEGELPPADFAEDRRGATDFYNLLDNITQDDYVLVAFEYGPAAAGELDLLAELLLRHIFAQRATPLIVSSNPIAVVHAQNIIRKINRSLLEGEAPLAADEDFHLLRYLPGGALGLRELSENFADVARVSSRGLLTGLDFASLEDMTLTLLITESADDLRNWAEQVLPEVASMDLLVATGYSAQPLAQAYADSVPDIVGPIYGLRDAYTYGEKLRANFEPLLPADSERQPEVEPAQISGPRVIGPIVSGEPEAEVEREPAIALPTDTATQALTATQAATATPQPKATDTPAPTATDTPAPTATDTPAPTATEAILLAVEITSPQRVNIRRRPTTVDDVLALGYPGDLYEVLGTNGDGSWYRIALGDGLEGWVAAFLVEEREVTASELAGGGANDSASLPRERTVMRLDFTLRLGKNQPRYYQAPAPLPGDRPELALSRERGQEAPRLHAMTLGTIAAVLVIVVGNLFYATRGLLRRSRRV
ncbi:MAG: SH3 domain-containing protein [Chloroflexi bacterium]|nr:SH3 domain-containing protein [Chloroflexota bacterium]